MADFKQSTGVGLVTPVLPSRATEDRRRPPQKRERKAEEKGNRPAAGGGKHQVDEYV